MKLNELDPENYWRIRGLASDLGQLHLSVAAVVEGGAEGAVHVDDTSKPTLAILDGAEGTYLLASGEMSPVEARAVAEHLDDWVYLHVADGGINRGALPNAFMLKHERLIFSLPIDGPSEKPLPAGYALVRDDNSFGHRIYSGDTQVARCLPDVVVENRAEIGVWTHAAHRRRGLASCVLHATLNAAKTAGIQQVGWHCHTSNAGSIALARGVGAGEPMRSVAFSASLPAENHGDLSPLEWKALAEHFLSGRDEIAWLGFHAACALAAAGATDDALDAVERLVEDRWHGRPSWLVHHWALSELAGHPRMLAAIDRLGKQKAPPV